MLIFPSFVSISMPVGLSDLLIQTILVFYRVPNQLELSSADESARYRYFLCIDSSIRTEIRLHHVKTDRIPVNDLPSAQEFRTDHGELSIHCPLCRECLWYDDFKRNESPFFNDAAPTSDFSPYPKRTLDQNRIRGSSKSCRTHCSLVGHDKRSAWTMAPSPRTS